MKIIVLYTLLLVTSITAAAQKGNNQIGIGGEIGFPTGAFSNAVKTGLGGGVKFLIGAGRSGQVTFTAGYTSFSVKGSGSEYSANYGILPIMIGYRQFIVDGLYSEPQLGYGSYSIKVKGGGQTASTSRGAFTYAIGFGYVVDDVDIGIRYQDGKIDGDSFSYVGIRLGYNFALKHKSYR